MKESYSMKEMAVRKFELPFGAIFSFQQLDGLIEARDTIRQLWKDHRSLWEYIQKLRMYAIETDQQKLFDKWEKDNRIAFLGFKSLNKLRDKLHVKICAWCGIAFKGIYKNRMYCSDPCKGRALRNRAKSLQKKNNRL